MKRFKLLALALFMGLCFIAAPASAALVDMQAQVYTWDGSMKGDGTPVLVRVTSGITFTVLAIDSNTAETLYYPGSTTELTNPVSTTNFGSSSVCNDRVAFRVDPTDATNDRYVDVLVTNTAGGFTAFVENFDQYQHSIVIDQRPNVLHHGCIPFSGVTPQSTGTGVVFESGTNLRSVQLEVITGLSGQIIRIGRSSATPASFINMELLTNTGFIQTAEASMGTDLGNGSTQYPNGYVFTTSTEMYYNSDATSTTPNGYIHYYFSKGR